MVNGYGFSYILLSLGWFGHGHGYCILYAVCCVLCANVGVSDWGRCGVVWCFVSGRDLEMVAYKL